jgi:hypothetical protein
MIKFRDKGKEYWVGHNHKVGYVIYDPLVQNAESIDEVRLYVTERNKSSSFKKEIIKSNLTPNESPWVLRRLQLLREWSHEQVEQVFP